MLSLAENVFVKENPLQDLLYHMNAVISTNQRNWILTGHVIFKLHYNQIYQMKTTMIRKTLCQKFPLYSISLGKWELNQRAIFVGISKLESSSQEKQLSTLIMSILDNYLCFLILGIKDYGESNCDHVELLTQAKNAIPKGYTRNVFCAYSSVGEEATCRGDSGKYVMSELLLINA